MFYISAVRKPLLFFMINVMFLLPSVVSANAGTGNGDGDGVSGYRSSLNSKLIRDLCGNQIDSANNTPSNVSATSLGICLRDVRANHIYAPYDMVYLSRCRMLDMAADEACRGQWGFAGTNHKKCKVNFTDKIARREGWFLNFGYCQESCVNYNPRSRLGGLEWVDANVIIPDDFPCAYSTPSGYRLPPGTLVIP